MPAAVEVLPIGPLLLLLLLMGPLGGALPSSPLPRPPSARSLEQLPDAVAAADFLEAQGDVAPLPKVGPSDDGVICTCSREKCSCIVFELFSNAPAGIEESSWPLGCCTGECCFLLTRMRSHRC